VSIGIVLPEIDGEDFVNGYYLSGKNGELLRSLLRDAGISTDHLHVTDAEQDVKAFVELVRPAFIIAFGNEALRVTTKKSGIKKYRGDKLQLHESYGFDCCVYPTYSIQDLRNVPTFKKTMIADLRRTQQQEDPDNINFTYWSSDES